MPDQKELVGRIALVEQILLRFEAMIAGAAGDQVAVLAVEPGKERVFAHNVLKSRHALSLSQALDWPGSPRLLP